MGRNDACTRKRPEVLLPLLTGSHPPAVKLQVQIWPGQCSFRKVRVSFTSTSVHRRHLVWNYSINSAISKLCCANIAQLTNDCSAREQLVNGFVQLNAQCCINTSFLTQDFVTLRRGYDHCYKLYLWFNCVLPFNSPCVLRLNIIKVYKTKALWSVELNNMPHKVTIVSENAPFNNKSQCCVFLGPVDTWFRADEMIKDILCVLTSMSCAFSTPSSPTPILCSFETGSIDARAGLSWLIHNFNVRAWVSQT